jgi:hypothetical protein
MVRPAHVWFDLTQDNAKKNESEMLRFMDMRPTYISVQPSPGLAHFSQLPSIINNILKQILFRLFQSAPME